MSALEQFPEYPLWGRYKRAFDWAPGGVERILDAEITFVHSGLETTPFEAESFDAIVSCDVLEHVNSDLACLSELHRLLKPGGVAVLTMPHDGPLGFMDPDNWGVSAGALDTEALSAPLCALQGRPGSGGGRGREQGTGVRGGPRR